MRPLSHGRIVHSVPGRLRLRFGDARNDPTELAPLLARLRERPGVRAARYHSTSGSLIVEYDPAVLPAAALRRDLPILPDEAAPRIETENLAAARAVTTAWWEANASVARVSGGRVDLRMIVPLALVLLAVRQLIILGELEAAPWHALLWYAYNLFYQFHPEIARPPAARDRLERA
jgi:hypothetical protein